MYTEGRVILDAEKHIVRMAFPENVLDGDLISQGLDFSAIWWTNWGDETASTAEVLGIYPNSRKSHCAGTEFFFQNTFEILLLLITTIK